MGIEESNEKPRYNGPTEDEMTDEQRRIRESILKTRPRTGISGPFGPWLAIPSIAEPAQLLGRACRYDTSLSFRESELVILLTGAKFESRTEFEIHRKEALLAGLSHEVIESIPHGPEFTLENVIGRVFIHLSSSREKSIAGFAAELLSTNTVGHATYEDSLKVLGGHHSTLVEITSIVGYYAYVAFTLNVFKISPGT